jgi:beta-galactosidase
MTQPLPISRIHFGAAFYPEHWPEASWREDIRLMQAAGVTVVRLAEFSWSSLEPAAGEFNFGWLDRAIAELAKAGIVSVLGTPTAAPPAWLVQQHPNLLAVDENGRRVQFGNRCHACVNSSEFQSATRRLVGALAEHFGPNPKVIGWQIDNEFNRVCHCERCRAVFQTFLASRYGSLEALNKKWSTAYWSQAYSSWEQIPIPIGPHNPGLMLEFKHFVTDSYCQFQHLQIELLRPHLMPGVWITHNMMGWFDGIDYYALAQELDQVSLDWYIGMGNHDYLKTGAIHDLTRGFKRRNYWIMETQPGNVNWAPINNSLDKGKARAMAWQAIAHGADAILYWQWRSALGGQEQLHGTLVDPSGQPRPFYEEAQQLGHELARVSSLLSNTAPVAEVALLNSYPSRWSIAWQPHHRDFDYVDHFDHYYRPLARRNIGVDILSADMPIEGYKLVIAPALLILDETCTAHLIAFVESGGHLVLTLRSGMKDKYNALLPVRQPGPLTRLSAVEVEEYYALLGPIPVLGEGFKGSSSLWAERLKVLQPAGVEILARYGTSNGWLDGQAAVTAATHGRGRVYFVGAYLDAAAQQFILDQIVRTAGVKPILGVPAGVEVRARVNSQGEQVYIIINHERKEQQVSLPWPGHEHLGGTNQEKVKLEPYGVAVITRSN